LRKARARVRALNRSSGYSWACGPEADCGSGDGVGEDRPWTQVRVVLGVEERPDRHAPPVSARRRKREARAGWSGLGERMGREREARERGGEGGRGPGRKGRKEKRKRRKENGPA
jgi:hypothetical protein